MRSDFKIMRELATFTRVTPLQRKAEMMKFVQRIAENEEASNLLASWGLKLADNPIRISGRVMGPERIIFGGNYSEMVSPKADWTRAATTKLVIRNIRQSKTDSCIWSYHVCLRP